MSLFPSLFLVRSAYFDPYLAVDESQAASSNLRFDEKKFATPRATFAVEHSDSGGRDLVHIRSCHNNKYWAPHEVDGQVVFRASAEDPVDDTKDPKCTLFLVALRVSSEGEWFCSFKCISKNMNLRSNRNILTLATSIHSKPEFYVVDLETRFVLPSQVTFKSENLKDHHLVSRPLQNSNFHRFESGKWDMGDRMVAHELVQTLDGSYQIKNMHFGMFWFFTGVSTSGWILASRNTVADHDPLSKFLFFKVSDDVFALRSEAYRRFCGPLTADGKQNCLNSSYPTLTRQVRLIVQERVLERTIENIRYRFDDSRIYQKEFVEATHAFVTNSTNKEDEMTLKFSIEESKTTSWKNSISVKLGVKVQLKVTIIPVILTGKVQASAEVGYQYEWGETKTTTTKRELIYTIKVPPYSKRKVTIVCTKAACDVPYSYTQRDLLPDGKRVSVIKDDGVFFGVNSYDFEVEHTEVTEDALGRMYL